MESNTVKPAVADAVEPIDPAVALAAEIESARRLLLAHGWRVITPNAQSARSVVAKADPTAVKAYFDSTGLSRSQLADAVGVSNSVIATVQNVNGDRWSQSRFDAAKPLIEAYKAAITPAKA